MSIKTYLETLDLDQLRRAVQSAEHMIKVRTEGKKISYWEIWSDQFPTEYFAENQYKEACDRVTEIMKLNGDIDKENWRKDIEFRHRDAWPSELPEILKHK